MKTTLDLPDDLMVRVKIHAVHERKKLKDAIAELLERGMTSPSSRRAPERLPEPLKLKGRGPLSLEEIEAAIAEGRE